MSFRRILTGLVSHSSVFKKFVSYRERLVNYQDFWLKVDLYGKAKRIRMPLE